MFQYIITIQKIPAQQIVCISLYFYSCFTIEFNGNSRSEINLPKKKINEFRRQMPSLQIQLFQIKTVNFEKHFTFFA